MKSLIRLVSAVLSVAILVLSFASCKKNDQAQDDTSSVVSTIKPSWEEALKEDNTSKMLDGNVETFWSVEEGTTTQEFSLEKETTFNAIKFDEHNDYITDYIVEIKENGEWKQIYRQDEMGKRVGIIDETVTAKDFRITVTSSQNLGGLNEISFSLEDGFEATNFCNKGYFTVSRIDKMRETNFSELTGLTDIILFDFGSWDKNGNFLWGSKGAEYNEAFLQKVLEEVKTALNGRKINIWFSLQNYNKETTEHTGQLFATEQARKNLTDFAVNLCKKYGFYGVDIDYEYPSNSKEYTDVAWKNYNLFLQYAAKALHKNGYKLSCAFYPKMTQVEKETIELIDHVNVMSYDMMDRFGRHSGYAVCEKSYSYFLELGFKPEQLILGLPYYTKTTTGEAGPGYNWIINRWRNSVKPWVNFTHNNTYTYYFNGPYIIRDKVFYAMSNNMGGVFNWCMGADVPVSDERSLALTVDNTIKRFSK